MRFMPVPPFVIRQSVTAEPSETPICWPLFPLTVQCETVPVLPNTIPLALLSETQSETLVPLPELMPAPLQKPAVQCAIVPKLLTEIPLANWLAAHCVTEL